MASLTLVPTSSSILFSDSLPISTETFFSTSTLVTSTGTSTSSTTSTPSSTSQSITSSTTSTPSSTSQSITSSTGTASSLPGGTYSTTASTNSTSTAPTSTAVPNASGSNLSAGAVAGIGIGTAIVGALLALLIVAFLMKRRKKRTSYNEESNYPLNKLAGGDSPSAIAGSGTVDDFLAIPAADSDIKKSHHNLATMIENHVDNYYHSDQLNSSVAGLLPAIAALGYDGRQGPKMPAEQFLSLIVSPPTRSAAIQQLIALVVVSAMKPMSSADRSLLPPFIVQFCHAMPAPEKRPNSGEQFTQVYNKWRQMSGYLLSTWRGNREAPKVNDPNLPSAISNNIATLNSVLSPFIKPQSQHDQRENLRGIFLDASEFAVVLFTQPSSWSFEWTADQSSQQARHGKGNSYGGRQMVVFPALGTEVYEHGVSHWKPFKEAVVA